MFSTSAKLKYFSLTAALSLLVILTVTNYLLFQPSFSGCSELTTARRTLLSSQNEKSLMSRDIDCCTAHTECTSAYPVPPLVRKSDQSCPKRYIYFAEYGQLDDIVRSLVSALWMGSHLGRTVVLPETGHASIFNFIDLSQVCAEYWPEERFKQEYERNPSQTIRTLIWSEDWPMNLSPPAFNDTMQLEWILLDGNHFDKQAQRIMPSVLCLLQSLPPFPYDNFLFMARTFFTLIDPESYKTMLRLLPHKKTVNDIGDAAIESLFDNQPFIGIDLRSVDGNCEEMMRTDFQTNRLKVFLPDAVEACSPSWENLEMRLKRYDIEVESMPIYLVDNGQQPNVTDAILQNHPKVRRLTDFPLMNEIEHRDLSSVLDAYILSRSSSFIGIAGSSFAFHIALRRELYGFAKESNFIPGYRETGYMPHFFNNVDV
jgi:hypothetical protein